MIDNSIVDFFINFFKKVLSTKIENVPKILNY